MPTNNTPDNNRIDYSSRNVVFPRMRVGESLRVTWRPYYFAANVSLSHNVSSNISRSGSGNRINYSMSRSGSGIIEVTGDGRTLGSSFVVYGGGGTDKANRLPLQDLENSITLSPGMRYNTVSLLNFEWNLTDDDIHEDLSFRVTPIQGQRNLVNISQRGSSRLRIDTGANTGRVVVQIVAEDNGGNDVGDPVEVEIIVYDLQRRIPPRASVDGTGILPLPTSFQDPVADISSIDPTPLDDGYTETPKVWTVAGRHDGRISGVILGNDLKITITCVREDEASFPTKILNEQAGSLWSHASRLDNADPVFRWGVRTPTSG